MRRGSKVVGAVCPALAIAQMHGCETTAGQQVWVLQQLLGLADRCIGQAIGFWPMSAALIAPKRWRNSGSN